MAFSPTVAQSGGASQNEGASMASPRAAFTAAIFLMLAACGDPTSRVKARTPPETASSAEALTPDLAEAFVKAHAPKAEARLINSAEQFSARQDVISGGAGKQLDNRKAESWREVVRGAVNFTGWVASIDRVEPTGRIYLKLTRNMFLWSDIDSNSPLGPVLQNLRSRRAIVYISGSIAHDDTAGLKGDIDSISPTCFEAASGPQGCHVDLTDLRPLSGGD